MELKGSCTSTKMFIFIIYFLFIFLVPDHFCQRRGTEGNLYPYKSEFSGTRSLRSTGGGGGLSGICTSTKVNFSVPARSLRSTTLKVLKVFNASSLYSSPGWKVEWF